MNNFLGADNGGGDRDCTNDSGGGDGSMNIIDTTMTERCFIIEKEDSYPENTDFSGRSGGLLQSLMK